MKLLNILKEIGQSDVAGFGYTPTKVSSDNDRAYYTFETDSGNLYGVNIVKWEGEAPDGESWMFDVAFGTREEGSESIDTEVEVNDPKNLFRVMGAVIKALRQEMTDTEEESGRPVTRIELEPTKRQIKDKSGIKMDDPNDTRRANLYMAYLKKEFPNSEIKFTKNKGKIWVDII